MIERTSLARAVERCHGRPLEEVVRDICARSTSPEQAARELDISIPTLRVWKAASGARFADENPSPIPA